MVQGSLLIRGESIRNSFYRFNAIRNIVQDDEDAEEFKIWPSA